MLVGRGPPDGWDNVFVGGAVLICAGEKGCPNRTTASDGDDDDLDCDNGDDDVMTIIMIGWCFCW